MTASEQMFFLGAPLAHVAQFEQRLRLERESRLAALGRSRGLYTSQRRARAGDDGL